ncbi:MAG: O-antigen ligase family protein [Cyanobacteria bacterium J06643_13]
MNKNWCSFFEPKPAWQAILGLIFTILILLFTVPSLLVPIFPLGSLGVGIFLYRRYPILYVGFTWWVWFLGIFVRRLIDFRCGFITPWPYALTPILVTSITIATVVRYLPRTYKRHGLPFVLCLFAVFYGFIIGLIQQQVSDYDREIIILLTWLSPICFGFHLFVNWKDYPHYRQLIQRVFLWSVIVMGVYGIFQFLVAPGWDKFFLVNSSQFNSAVNSSYMGSPVPLGIRVWSTMGNPMTFSFNLMPGLILLLTSKSSWRYPANIVGYLVLLISQVRTAWYSWLITVALYIFSLKEKYQIRAMVAISLLVLLIIPLANVEPFASVIGSRLETFSNLSTDGSLQSRLGQLEETSSLALGEFLGWGLVAPGQSPNGSFSTNDNGYLVILITFGWFGTLIYMSGILMLITESFRAKNADIFAVASRAIAIGSLARMITSNVSTEQYAMPIWCFLSLAVASHRYYSYQKRQSILANDY